MTNKSESVILCEGYHDRAFWAGWLKKLRCRSLYGASDPRGNAVSGGHFAFKSPEGRFLRVVPCKGDTRVIRRTAKPRLEEHEEFPLDHLLINLDLDCSASDDAESRRKSHLDNWLGWLQSIGYDDALQTDSNELRFSMVPPTRAIPSLNPVRYLARPDTPCCRR